MSHYSFVDFCTKDTFMSCHLSHQLTSHKKLPNPFFSLPSWPAIPSHFLPKFQLHLLPFLLQKLTPILLIFLDHHSSLKGDLDEEDAWWFRACFLVVLHPTLGRKVTSQNPHFFPSNLWLV